MDESDLLIEVAQSEEPLALQWDLHREKNSIDKVEWPSALKGKSAYVIKGKEIQLGIGLSESRLLMSHCDRVEVEQADNQISAVIVFSVPMTKENTGLLIASYRRMFDMNGGHTDKKVRVWNKEDRAFTFGDPKSFPPISIDVAKSFDSAKPWHLIMRLNFVRLPPERAGDEPVEKTCFEPN